MENDAIKECREMLDESEFIKHLGIELLEISDKSARGRMPFSEKYLNPGGTMHGGCLYSLADTVAGTLATYVTKKVVTVEGSLHFLGAATDTKYVYCDADMQRCGKHLVVVDVRITDDDGRLLDSGCYTFFRMDEY